jgi:hypothetical protein
MVTEGDIGKAKISYANAPVVQYLEGQFPDQPQSFGLRYLVTILKAATKPMQTVTVSLTRDTPLLIGVSNETMTISFYLAPKFDSADDDD